MEDSGPDENRKEHPLQTRALAPPFVSSRTVSWRIWRQLLLQRPGWRICIKLASHTHQLLQRCYPHHAHKTCRLPLIQKFQFKLDSKMSRRDKTWWWKKTNASLFLKALNAYLTLLCHSNWCQYLQKTTKRFYCLEETILLEIINGENKCSPLLHLLLKYNLCHKDGTRGQVLSPSPEACCTLAQC